MIIDKLRITAKIWLPAIIFSIALIAVAGFAANNLHDTLLNDRQDKVRSVVEEAHSIIEGFVKAAESGKLTVEEAQAQAKDVIRSIRYDGKEYMWINDMDKRMLMHAVKPSLEGKDLSKLEDKKGKLIFTEFVNTINKNNGQGFVDYYWPKAGEEEPIQKISYVKLSPAWQWVVGSGLYLDDVEKAFQKEFNFFAVLVGIALFLAGGVSVLVAKNLSGGLNAISDQMTQLSQGQLDVDITEKNRADELGDMSKALEVFKQNASEAESLRASQEQTRMKADEERHAALLKMADDLQDRMRGVVGQMGDVVGNLGNSAETMHHNAQETNKQSSSVAAISDQTSANVQTVAAAAEQLNASSSEIGRQVEHTNQTAQSAAAEAAHTNEVIQGLNGAAAKIGEVVSMIQDIAEQTNLLALNATIEAARAGEAGKGFAVVASEVKNLANQTAKATDQVSHQITTIQGETNRAVDAIGGISKTINNVNDASSAIAAAVEQQHAAIQEISRSVQEAARGTNEISTHIAEVSKDAEQTMRSADEVNQASQKLTESSQNVDRTVDEFVQEIRSSSSS